MGKPTTGEELLAVLEASQLVHKNLLDTLRTQLKSLGPAAQDPQKLALILIKNKVCTTYQVRQLLEGRFKGFYIGKYKFLELLGAGGMGKVFLAEQITMQRLVAIKVVRQNIPKNMQKEVLARFTREARAVAGLQHHNIIRAYDFDQENGIPYFVMEYVEGIDAANQVIKFGPIPYQQAADYMMQAASALQHAHKNGMVHRDIKPGNLLVATSGEIKVLDLGLVACFDGTQNHSLTVAENQLGTIDYIAPEQALDSHKVDPRADIYSLGATFYTIISGKVLFPGKTTAQKLLLNQMEEPTHIKQHVPDIPDELAAAIHKMLAKKPDDRFQSCEEVIQALTPFSSRIVPPYDPTAVKFRISDIDEYLGRSPEASQINFNLINQDTPTPETKINSPSDTKKAAPTAAAVAQAEDEFLKAINEMAELDLPSVPRKRAAAASGRGGTATLSAPSTISARSTIGSRSRVTNKKPIKKKGNDSQNTATLVVAITTLLVAVMFIVYYSVSSLFKKDSQVVSQAPFTQQQIDQKVNDSKKNHPAETKPASNNVAKNEENKPNNKKNEEKKPKPEPDKPKPPADTSVANNNNENKSSPSDLAMTTTPSTENKPPVDPPKNEKVKPDENKPDSKNSKAPTPETPEARWLAYTKQMQDDDTLVWHSTFLKGKDNKGAVVDNQAGKSPIAKAKLVLRNVQPAPGRFENKEAIGFPNKLAEEFAGIPNEILTQADFSKGASLAIWFRADPENNESYALLNRGRTSWRIHRIKGKGVLQFSNGPINTRNLVEVESTSDFTPGDWHLVVGTIRPSEDQAVLTLYLDGQKESAKKGPILQAEIPTGVMLGQAQDTTGSRLGFRGLIDEFAIYNRPLSDDEVRQMYEAGSQHESAGVAASSN